MIEKKVLEVNGHKPLEVYTITKSCGAQMEILNYGGIVSKLVLPDSKGNFSNVCLGFDDPEDYLNEHPFFGALVGRYGNRIAKGSFELNGETCRLPINNGENTLHGGPQGFDKAFWEVSVDQDDLCLSHVSPDGDQGFPGELKVDVRYSFNEELVWRIEYKAESNKSTPINLTQHAYFNLNGAGSGDILNHEVEFKADHYTPVNDQVIPTGEIRPVAGSEYDFSSRTLLRDRFEKGYEYDHNMVLPAAITAPQCAAFARDLQSGRTVEMWTTEPGFQFYTANFLDGSLGNSTGRFEKWGGFCLEAQNFPDAVHHDNFPNCILNPGEIYTQVTEYRFGN